MVMGSGLSQLAIDGGLPEVGVETVDLRGKWVWCGGCRGGTEIMKTAFHHKKGKSNNRRGRQGQTDRLCPTWYFWRWGNRPLPPPACFGGPGTGDGVGIGELNSAKEPEPLNAQIINTEPLYGNWSGFLVLPPDNGRTSLRQLVEVALDRPPFIPGHSCSLTSTSHLHHDADQTIRIVIHGLARWVDYNRSRQVTPAVAISKASLPIESVGHDGGGRCHLPIARVKERKELIGSAATASSRTQWPTLVINDRISVVIENGLQWQPLLPRHLVLGITSNLREHSSSEMSSALN